MSRTFKKTRNPGFEYWSKRPGSNNYGACPGKPAKRETHRAERRQNRSAEREELREVVGTERGTGRKSK